MTDTLLPAVPGDPDDDSQDQAAQDGAAAPESAHAVYADVTDRGGELRPIIPREWRRENLRSTLHLHARRHVHKTAYHGLRSPLYGIRAAFYAVRGAAVLTARVMRWWHWTEGWLLESQAVAAGRAGHQHAMSAHTQGLRTRGRRGRILAVCAVLAVAALLALWVLTPHWSLAILAVVAGVVLVKHGKPAGKAIVTPAVISSQYETPTHAIITQALDSLRIKAINDLVAAGIRLGFLDDPHQSGPGWVTNLDLPHGVTATQVLAKREQLASGLRRPLSAVWPTPVPHEHPGRIEIWIGYQDASKVKPPPWPLLKAGQASVFDPFPFGNDPRMRKVEGALFEHNWLIGSAPGQGKTGAIRVLACAAALDPLAEIWMHELKGIGDLEQFAPISHRYVSGLDDEAIAYAAASLSLLRAELESRSLAMKKLPKEARPEGKVTRDMAARRSLGLYPLVGFFDEVQNLFMHPKYGKQAQEDAAYVIRMGRAYAVILVLSSQRPTSETIPAGVTGNVTTRFCLQVPGQVENDVILGTSAYKNGYNAAAFRPKTDAGTGWLRGENATQVVRAYKLDLSDAAAVVKRARLTRERAGTLTGYALGEDDSSVRDVLADVLAVMGSDTGIHWPVLAERLAQAFPDRWGDTNAEAISAQCRGLGVRSQQVKVEGVNLNGCRRLDVERSAARDA